MRLILCFFGLSLLSCVHDLKLFRFSVSKQKIRDVVLWPLNGLSFRLSELKHKKAFVFVVRDDPKKEDKCSVSDNYGYLLKEMEKDYIDKGIQFIYLYVGQKDSHKRARKDLKNFGFQGSYVVDLKQRLINILSVVRTGDIIILNSDRELVYKGPLYGDYKKTKRNYVREVLSSVLSGKKVKRLEIKNKKNGCLIERPILPKKVYWKQVYPIIRDKCTKCHNPNGIAPMDFLRYEDVVGRRGMFEYVIANDLMPPIYLADNLEYKYKGMLSMREKALLLKWIQTGFKRNRSPPLLLKKEIQVKKEETADYQIKSLKPVVVPKEGFLYHTYLVNPNFKEDKWIQHTAFYMKPKVIHHAKLYVMKPNFTENNDYHKYTISEISFGSSSITNYYKNGRTVKVPANHKFFVEIHYEAQGQKIIDNYSHIKIRFHKKRPKYQHKVFKIRLKNEIQIPPKKADYHIKKRIPVKKTMNYITNIGVHMHGRGKRASLFLIDSKGNRKRIFGLDPFLILFEKSAKLQKPISISAGSTLEYNWWFDNSSNNLSNPDPNKWITFGLDKIESEMGVFSLYSIESIPPAL